MSLPTFKIHAWGRRATIFATVFLVIYFFKLWQPRRQIELHQKNLFLAVENRRWDRVEGLVSEKYSDRFGHNRQSATADLREVMRYFLVATIRNQGTQTSIAPPLAIISTNLTLTGNGTDATEFITSKVNQLTEPWIFTWRKESFWPWDWKLVLVDNQSLSIGDRAEPF